MVKHGKDPRKFGQVDPTESPSWKKQYCFAEFCGTVSRDPEMSHFSSGARKVRMSVSWRQNKKEKASGEWKAQYHYIDTEVWNELADEAMQLRKGDCITLKGILKMDSWEERDTGKKRNKVFIEVSEFELIERKGDPNLENAKADAEWEKSKPKPMTTDSGEIPDDIPF